MRRTFFYGWVVVAVTAIVVIIVSGVRSAPGAFLVSMTREPGWSTAFVAAGWIAIIAGFAALGIRRARPAAPGDVLPAGAAT